VDLSWLDDLPPADATTLHGTTLSGMVLTTARVQVTEVFEQQSHQVQTPSDSRRPTVKTTTTSTLL
jgi:hypothetical protein